MRFLVIDERRQPLPEGGGAELMDATEKWMDANEDVMITSWGNVGKPGGGAIVEVDSFEQLESIMLQYPLSRYSDRTITPILDLKDSFRVIHDLR
jgi:hypothetical protein